MIWIIPNKFIKFKDDIKGSRIIVTLKCQSGIHNVLNCSENNEMNLVSKV